MPPKLSAAEIEARDAARLNELGYKQVKAQANVFIVFHLTLVYVGIKKRIVCKLSRCLK
jgi:hypothetical protein